MERVAKVINGQFAGVFLDKHADGEEFFPLELIQPPSLDPSTQKLDKPVYEVQGNKVVERIGVVDLTPEEVEQKQNQLKPGDFDQMVFALIKDDKIKVAEFKTKLEALGI